jgi:hypothetical protein
VRCPVLFNANAFQMGMAASGKSFSGAGIRLKVKLELKYKVYCSGSPFLLTAVESVFSPFAFAV